MGADSDVRTLLDPASGSKKTDLNETKFRQMTLRGVGILAEDEIPEELEPEHIRVQHCALFDKEKATELVCGFLNEYLEEEDFKHMTGLPKKRDGSDFLGGLCEALEELSDGTGNTFTWKAAAGFCLESSIVADLVFQLPSGYTLHCWKAEE
eukprot:TRINITY_DN39268_c0_g1_i2.p2 TRINITY_DN39268_c0_g1~~TRINITY_DN39268_c0_g1_i2.p2  ORF type:complete len:152 (-),score=48.12 TRINITY_DN39268_c0_g1_i2:351-806(-)